MNHSIKKIISKVISLILAPLKYIIPKGNVIILQTYSPYIYCENTKYLFEYLSENTDYDVRWVTESKEIQNHLDSKGYKYITKSKIFKMIYAALRAKIVIDSGSKYFNFLNLIGSKTVKITTMHGNGPKATLAVFDDLSKTLEEVYNFDRFDYVNFPSDYSCSMIGRRNYFIQPDKLICLGYPRCDNYFNEKYVSQKHKERNIFSALCENADENGRIVLYTPTWRPYQYDLPLLILIKDRLDEFVDFLEKENIYFFYTTHSANVPDDMLPNSGRLKYIDNKKYHSFDINLFMIEVDLLLNDYSTTSTEFALLKRPQIFFMPDYDHYKIEKGFVENYKSILPGKEVRTFDEFTSLTSQYLRHPETYMSEYENSINMLLEKYYDVSLTNSSQLFAGLIEDIIKKD